MLSLFKRHSGRVITAHCGYGVHSGSFPVSVYVVLRHSDRMSHHLRYVITAIGSLCPDLSPVLREATTLAIYPACKVTTVRASRCVHAFKSQAHLRYSASFVCQGPSFPGCMSQALLCAYFVCQGSTSTGSPREPLPYIRAHSNVSHALSNLTQSASCRRRAPLLRQKK